MSLFPFIIVLVAALNVVGTQAVVVREREREIAILRAMGATRTSVGTVFLTQGFAVGAVGTLCGLLVGGAGCLLLSTVGYPLDPNVYLISELPVVIEPGTFLLAGGSATLLTFGASWWAARRAASAGIVSLSTRVVTAVGRSSAMVPSLNTTSAATIRSRTAPYSGNRLPEVFRPIMPPMVVTAALAGSGPKQRPIAARWASSWRQVTPGCTQTVSSAVRMMRRR